LFYKVISRAINNRFKKISDRFMSRAQKGFTSARQIQEVILNITNSISFCKANNISRALVSVDQAKAFDTIFHGFVRASYNFFGVGEKFLDMLDTLGTNRQAKILLNDNKSSRTFPLGTGRPQGDPPSPLEFNGGEQILIFRIEQDPGIRSVYAVLQVPRNLFPVNPETIPIDFRNESNGETDKADGFADDNSSLTIMEQNSLGNLKSVLIDFAVISGLK
jgi:Reverse transcriptase (RNA-dependent DNA polymerase)